MFFPQPDHAVILANFLENNFYSTLVILIFDPQQLIFMINDS